jgi:hypothetical protein
MSLVTVGSLIGSPGATSIAIELTAGLRTPAVLVEADPDGGRLAARFDLVIRPGLAEFAAAARSGVPDDVFRFSQRCGPRGIDVVVAHPGADAVTAALAAFGDGLVPALRARSDVTVVVDIGRYRSGVPTEAIAAAADVRFVVTGTSLESLAVLAQRRELVMSPASSVVIAVGDGGYGVDDVRRIVDVPVVAAPAVAEHVTRRRSRAQLLRAIDELTAHVRRSEVV